MNVEEQAVKAPRMYPPPPAPGESPEAARGSGSDPGGVQRSVRPARPIASVSPARSATPLPPQISSIFVSRSSPGAETSDAELIERAKRAEPVAMRLIYERYAKRVFTTVRRIAGDDSTAEDCAQEAWVRAFRALPTFRGEAKFGTWLLRIAMNQALSIVRRRSRRPPEEPLDPLYAAATVEVDVLDQLRLERALQRLPDGMRKILVLHDVQGFTHEEIATIMGNTPSTCRSQLFKARARMREILGRRLDREADEGEEETV
jgi:RNA polymerase sigma-70 factor, ECF subfamily